MKKLFSEWFYVPKHGRVSDKAMLARVVLTSVIMIVCLVAMSTSAYAFFSCDITSGSNHIEAADFSLNISIIGDSGSDEVVKTNVQTYTTTLKADVTYTVNISRAGTAQTGFCIISAANAVEPLPYHTCQLGVDDSDSNGGSDAFLFHLSVTEDTTVSFSAHWGTSSHYPDFANRSDEDKDKLYITEENDEIVIQIKSDNKAGSSTSTQNQSTTSTTATTETADTSASIEQTTTVTTTATLQTTTTESIPSTSFSVESDTATTSVTLAAATEASTTTTATTPQRTGDEEGYE